MTREERAREMVAGLARDSETSRFVFVAQSDRGEYASISLVEDESGFSEAELLAEYVSAISQRTGKDRETVLREIISVLNGSADPGGESGVE
jgi:hypothetical protein